MYTQCPDCRAVYQVSTEHLRQANGQVKCGQCNLQFNALLHLSDTIPARAAPTGEGQLQPETSPTQQPPPYTDDTPEPTPKTDGDADSDADTTGHQAAPTISEQPDAAVGDDAGISGHASAAHAEIEAEPEWRSDANATDAAPGLAIAEESSAAEEHKAESAAQVAPDADVDREAAADARPENHLEAEAGADAQDKAAAASSPSGTNISEESGLEEEGEYGTWLNRLKQHWDPGQTGSHDAWSRAAPQAETSASDLETDRETAQDNDPGRGPTGWTDPEPAADEGVSAGPAEDEAAQSEPDPEPVSTSGPVRGLDTGISYIESWAEELLAEVERDDAETERDRTKPEQHHADSTTETDAASGNTIDLAEETDSPALMPDGESAEGLDTAEATGLDARRNVDLETDRSAEETADQEAAPDADQHPPQTARSTAGTAAEPMPKTGDPLITTHQPALLDAESALAPPEPAAGMTAEPLTEHPDHPGEGHGTNESDDGAPADNWLEATWATDTQPSQPEAWLEPEFLDAEVLPEKLEGSGPGASAESGQQGPDTPGQEQTDPGPADLDAGDDHVATDPAIMPVANKPDAHAAPIGDDWPAFDDSSVIEDIVLESDEPAEAEQSDAVATDVEPATTARKTTSLLASGAESTGKVQAAAVQVSTDPQFAADGTAEEDMEISAAESAEQVARDLGLPRNRPVLRWVGRVLVLLIILVLLAAGVHSQRGVLMRNAALAPTLTSAYRVFGLQVQPDWDVSAFDIIDSSARSDGNDLVVEAAFANTADFAQPYPVLRVTLENRWGQAIGQEDFLPRNYLRAYAAGRLMDAAERARAEVTLRSPGAAAEGFSIDVCLESPGGRLQCLSDRR